MQRRKPEDLTYVVFMANVTEYVKNYSKETGCSCGGTGFLPVFCCDGKDCGCRGLPIDYETPCPKCGASCPDGIPMFFEDPGASGQSWRPSAPKA